MLAVPIEHGDTFRVDMDRPWAVCDVERGGAIVHRVLERCRVAIFRYTVAPAVDSHFTVVRSP